MPAVTGKLVDTSIFLLFRHAFLKAEWQKSSGCCVAVNVKWGKQKFDNVEVNTDEPPETFKGTAC